MTVVLAGPDYPARSDYSGAAIDGIDEAAAAGALVFHGGTAVRDGGLVTNGGRILSVTGLGPTVAEARREPTTAVDEGRFAGMRFRSDIAAAVESSSYALSGEAGSPLDEAEALEHDERVVVDAELAVARATARISLALPEADVRAAPVVDRLEALALVARELEVDLGEPERRGRRWSRSRRPPAVRVDDDRPRARRPAAARRVGSYSTSSEAVAVFAPSRIAWTSRSRSWPGKPELRLLQTPRSRSHR